MNDVMRRFLLILAVLVTASISCGNLRGSAAGTSAGTLDQEQSTPPSPSVKNQPAEGEAPSADDEAAPVEQGATEEEAAESTAETKRVEFRNGVAFTGEPALWVFGVQAAPHLAANLNAAGVRDSSDDTPIAISDSA